VSRAWRKHQGSDVLHHAMHPPVLPWSIARAPPDLWVPLSGHVISNFHSISGTQPLCETDSNRTPQAVMSNLSDTSRLKATVFVGGLDQAVTQQTLFHAFLPFGDIVEVNLPKPENQSQGEQHRGFGYVEFETAADAIDAIDNMDRSELYGSVIKVAPAKPQKDANEGLGSKTAIWEQVCVLSLAMRMADVLTRIQEGWLAKHAVSEEDRKASEQAKDEANGPMDPMQGLEGLDEAGPKPA
jgi:hypothetical protein